MHIADATGRRSRQLAISGDRELCMDADPAGSRDREPASKITPM